jgi:hypothetical protein
VIAPRLIARRESLRRAIQLCASFGMASAKLGDADRPPAVRRSRTVMRRTGLPGEVVSPPRAQSADHAQNWIAGRGRFAAKRASRR